MLKAAMKISAPQNFSIIIPAFVVLVNVRFMHAWSQNYSQID